MFGFLYLSSIILGVAIFGLITRVRFKKMDLGVEAWSWLFGLIGIAAAVFFVAAAVDTTWWITPGVLYLLLAILAYGGKLNAQSLERQAKQKRLTEVSDWPFSGEVPREVKVVDYNEFVVGLSWLTHARPDGGQCHLPLNTPTVMLSDLIDAANKHVCTTADAATLKSVA